MIYLMSHQKTNVTNSAILETTHAKRSGCVGNIHIQI